MFELSEDVLFILITIITVLALSYGIFLGMREQDMKRGKKVRRAKDRAIVNFFIIISPVWIYGIISIASGNWSSWLWGADLSFTSLVLAATMAHKAILFNSIPNYKIQDEHWLHIISLLSIFGLIISSVFITLIISFKLSNGFFTAVQIMLFITMSVFCFFTLLTYAQEKSKYNKPKQ